MTFGTAPANSFSVDSAGSITTQTPQQTAAGPVCVTVTVNTRQQHPRHEPGDERHLHLSPAGSDHQLDLVRNTGSTAGGTSIKIFGQYFTGATAVAIGGTSVTSFTVVSDTEIDANDSRPRGRPMD